MEIRFQINFSSIHGLESVQFVVVEDHGVKSVHVDRAPVGVPEDPPEAVVVAAVNQVRVHKPRPKIGASEICKWIVGFGDHVGIGIA